jgi:geranylgeranyl reductase family protein
MYDVVVVGAGPAGLRSARLCEQAGLEVLVLERKSEIGSPVQCSGLISTNLDRLVRPQDDCIEHRVNGAIVHGPGGKEIMLEKPGTAAYVIDRKAFDEQLAKQVKSEIRFETSLERLEFGREVRFFTNKGEVKSKAVIGCDGPSSVVRKHFAVRPHEILQGIIAIEKKPSKSRFVEMWLDRGVCDGFLWRIPRGKSVEYGMLGSVVNFSQLEKFFGLERDLEKRAGLIPIGPCKSYFDRALLVGDAAGQTKPWSGGGVVYGLICAGHAAKALREAFARDDLSEKVLAGYEKAWKAELDRPICMGMMFRELYKDMDEKQLGQLFEKFAGRELNNLDMDFPVLDF